MEVSSSAIRNRTLLFVQEEQDGRDGKVMKSTCIESQILIGDLT
jgi:hypothetical protein